MISIRNPQSETHDPAPQKGEEGPAGPELFCPQCGYSLRGIDDAGRCPECGLEIDREAFAVSQIPWVYRARIGSWRAFWRTVWLATWRPRVLAAEAVKVVEYGDAQRFRLAVVALTAAVLAVYHVVAVVAWGSTGFLSVLAPGVFSGAVFGGTRLGGPAPWLLDVVIPWEAGATLAAVMPLAAAVALLFVSGVASYWFHPRGLPVVRQNSAVALSYYACAPLVLLPVPVAAIMASTLLRAAGLAEPPDGWFRSINAVGFLGAVGFVAWAVLLWRSTMTLLSRATHPTAPRLAAAAVLVPVSWAACAAATLAVLPWVVGYVRLVVGSLRG